MKDGVPLNDSEQGKKYVVEPAVNEYMKMMKNLMQQQEQRTIDEQLTQKICSVCKKVVSKQNLLIFEYIEYYDKDRGLVVACRPCQIKSVDYFINAREAGLKQVPTGEHP